MTDIVVYGRGVTGVTLYNFAKKVGYNPCYYDDQKGFDAGGGFAKGVTVVKSPGVKPFAKGMREAAAAGAKVVTELDFCFPYLHGRCISVTGTNGKTTVCRMIHRVLSANGADTLLLGNGGVPLASALPVEADKTCVLESSSFQLEGTKSFCPYISVVTNVACDHLDYHKSVRNYVAAKKNNFLRQRQGYAIFNADDRRSMLLSRECRSRTLFYSVENQQTNIYVKEGVIYLRQGLSQQQVQSPFGNFSPLNLSNALCALLASSLMGVSLAEGCQALRDFAFPPHRLQQVAEFCGVSFVDDSKATNVHAVKGALKCFSRPLALILGGSDKGESFDPLFCDLPKNVVKIYAVGQTAEKICRSAAKYGKTAEVCSLDESVRQGFFALRDSGGIVLMSNGCASFDEFENFSRRGEKFAALAEELCREVQM